MATIAMSTLEYDSPKSKQLKSGLKPMSTMAAARSKLGASAGSPLPPATKAVLSVAPRACSCDSLPETDRTRSNAYATPISNLATIAQEVPMAKQTSNALVSCGNHSADGVCPTLGATEAPPKGAFSTAGATGAASGAADGAATAAVPSLHGCQAGSPGGASVMSAKSPRSTPGKPAGPATASSDPRASTIHRTRPEATISAAPRAR
mmetsp:Transcript_100351/g.288292  ORF Transcript_100351/g.288292 Transcript_100351/m.288292 type:complete len:207 (+) Transcript_100351:836-1456(+)